MRANEPDALRSVPARSSRAITGSAFADQVSRLAPAERERAIERELLDGNIPSFLRTLAPVRLAAPVSRDRKAEATIFVTRDYLAIGADGDYLRIPMNLHTARLVARRFQCILPTRKMVDAIYAQSACRFAPEPLAPGPQMTSTEYYRRHNAMIERQFQVRKFSAGALVSGHKKDVVLTNLLHTRPDRIAIYGWHRAVSAPIQPLSTVHTADYADYSHGIRLVAGVALVDGKPTPLQDLLGDARLAGILSDEGALRVRA